MNDETVVTGTVCTLVLNLCYSVVIKQLFLIATDI
jgi:hypothetical protein